jgi:hypothetical protein
LEALCKNPFDVFFKMLDEMKEKLPKNNTCTQKKHFLAQNVPP